MKRTFISALLCMMVSLPIMAGNTIADESSAAPKDGKKKKEVKYNEKGEIIKTGLNFGPLPVVAFDADRGFQYGALLNIFNFDDGSTYPNPKSSWYFEASAYTKGSSKFIITYDKKQIFPGIRMSACANYSIDKALDFYGFNGYQSIYDMDLVEQALVFDESKTGVKLENKFNEKGKLPKGFYRHGRKQFNAKVDFTGKIVENFFWEAGYSFIWTKADTFRPEGYNVYSNFTDGGTTLYDLYKDWGIIPEDQKNGGFSSALKAGLMFDTRNVENNPTRGIWAEAHVIGAPKWLGTSHPYCKFSATMRQYLPLGTDKLVFAYRLAYEGFTGNNAPWYLFPFYTSMGMVRDFDGYGGYRTVRGLMLNRVQGLHTGFYNAELRWRFIDFKLFNQNIAFALSGFCDGAHVFKGYDMTNRNEIAIAATTPWKNDLYNKFVNTSSNDGFHGSAGGGLRFIMNQNFIVAFEYARCFNKQDGNGAFYINTGFLF